MRPRVPAGGPGGLPGPGTFTRAVFHELTQGFEPGIPPLLDFGNERFGIVQGGGLEANIDISALRFERDHIRVDQHLEMFPCALARDAQVAGNISDRHGLASGKSLDDFQADRVSQGFEYLC